MSARLVIDASVAIKWILAEPDSSLAEPLIDEDLCAPDLLLVECANVVWRRVERDGADPEGLKQLFWLIRAIPIDLYPADALIELALDIAVEVRHPIYDCLYLALAVLRNARMVTADKDFVRLVRRNTNYTEHIVLLKDLAH